MLRKTRDDRGRVRTEMNTPSISIIMPCYNEERHIYDSIKSLINEYFKEKCELLVVDGMSEDRTRVIVQDFIDQDLNIRIVENKQKLQAYGMNLGISQASGEIIIRTDTHCVYPPNYIKKCVDVLKSTDAANVGGVMLPVGKTAVQKAISWALTHPIGVGDAKWHLGNYSGYVDTVYLGTFHKSLFDEIGLYDENSHPNEDAELNLRILKAGNKIYLDNSIIITYSPRETLGGLAKQYFKYGKGRFYTLLKHKKLTSLRQVAPVTLVLGLATSLVLSLWRPLFILFPMVYILSLLGVGILSWKKKKIAFSQRILMSAAWAVMHVSWGMGFLSYLIYRK